MNQKKIKLVSSFKPRLYQESIFANSIYKNSLVILPTGLGKTIIAIMLCVFYFNKNFKKVLFLAPTKPLVEQQEKSFNNFFENRQDFNFQVLTGKVSPQKRAQLYRENDFFFSTPQLIENDIINKIIKIEDFSLVVFDEAHRGVGNYAYCFIAEQFNNLKVKILALTASPGTSKDEIEEVIKNLKINHLEVKKSDDRDVLPYVKETKIENIYVNLPKEFVEIKSLLNCVLDKKVKVLQELNFLVGKKLNQITKTDLLNLQKILRLDIVSGQTNENTFKAISISSAIMKLQYGIELFESQEISSCYNYFYNFFRGGGDNSKAVQDLILDFDFRQSFEKISFLFKKGVKHPKLEKLKEIVKEEIVKNPDLKIIIFNQYRDSAEKIVSEISKIKIIKPALFVGQSRKGEVKLSQKEQKKILEDFRENKFNVIVSTSVGEEGLDIPKVDLVIFYEPVPSAIRTIQRIGRTGRFNKGFAFILIAKDTRDEIVKFIANAKERKMYKVLDSLKKDFENQKKDNLNLNLNKFLKPKIDKLNKDLDSKDDELKSSLNENVNKSLVYIDNRENSDLLKCCFKFDSFEVLSKKLDVGDIIINVDIGIERKSREDFVNSIIDKRLFLQLIDLKKNFFKPILIIEGTQSLFSIRNVNPNIIRSTLVSIAIDFQIPIIYTDSISETANIIENIVKRISKNKKQLSYSNYKTGFGENEELEAFVSSIPKINVVNAQNLLSNFKTIKDLVNCSFDDLIKVTGVGKTRAKFLIEFFKKEYNKYKF